MAYDAKGWANTMILRTAEQCLKDRRNPFANVKPGEGCRVSGTMIVNKVAGNFHMTLGESFVRDGAHIHQFIPAEAPGFNVSHTIHSLSFGDTYPSMPPNPLDNGELPRRRDSRLTSSPLAVRYCQQVPGTGLFQYFIKVVPTRYTNQKLLADTATNQYTVTEKFRPVVLEDFQAGGMLQVAAVSALSSPLSPSGRGHPGHLLCL
jgi:endoplasmic reticulum-Golgi intermediate compartment protein 3